MTNIPPIIRFNEQPISAQKIKAFIDPQLSEPYSYITYYQFIYECPQYTYMMIDDQGELVSILIGKLSQEENKESEGYIGMIVVREDYRGQGIAKKLVQVFAEDLMSQQCFKIALETEQINTGALRLYECKIKSFRILQRKILQKLLLKWECCIWACFVFGQRELINLKVLSIFKQTNEFLISHHVIIVKS